jgi:type II secretory pathway component PulF
MTSEIASSGQRTAAIILALVAMLFGIVPGVIGIFVIPSFQTVFQSFGSDLPALTKLVINIRYFLWLPSPLVPILWWPLRSSMARIYCYSIILACEVISISLIIYATYLPIFKLGAVV